MGVPDFDTALDELSDGPAPTDFADLALRRAARHLRRTGVLAVAGAAALIAVLALTAVTLRALPRHGIRAGASPGGKLAVLSYQLDGHHAGQATTYAWDPASHSYVPTSTVVRPSPDGRWGMVLGPLGVGIAPWADAVHQRNLRWKKVTGTPKWSPTGRVIVADLTHKTTTWITPESMAATTVGWPVELRSAQQVVYGFGGLIEDLAADEVVYWTYDRDVREYTTIVWTDPAGDTLRVTHLRTSSPAKSLTLPANDQADPSPDGRYINLQAGVVVDTQGNRVLYAVRDAQPIGWYSTNTVAFCMTSASADQNMVITPYLVTGPPLTSTPLDGLAGYAAGAGSARLYAAAAGQDTAGAVTF